MQITPELLKDEPPSRGSKKRSRDCRVPLDDHARTRREPSQPQSRSGSVTLQSQLKGTENRITVARKRYIDKVAEFEWSATFSRI